MMSRKYVFIFITFLLLSCGVIAYRRHTEKAKLTAPFNQAVFVGDEKKVKALLEEGVYINNHHSAEGYTPLHLAIECGHDRIALLLIQKGADIDATDEYGGTILDRTIHARNERIFDELIKRKVQITDINESLHLAAYAGDPYIVSELIRLGADVNAVSPMGRNYSPLHVASNADVAKILIRHGATVNSRSAYDGRTPLHLAVMYQHADVVQVLLANNADTTVKDKSGMTPLDRAKKNHSGQIVNMLAMQQ